jgi:tol-pal system protein YbgF
MKRVLILCLALLPLKAGAQDTQTLADIRQDLSVLYVEVQRLKRELSTTGGSTVSVQGSDPLERLDAIEAELQRLTGKTEEIEFRLNGVIADGTNRVGDLEFRLCELEPGCDVGKLGAGTTLGGGTTAGTAPAAPPATSGPATTTTQLAVGEEADFGRASEALAKGDFRGAADLFATFSQTYPGGPLGAEAHLMRGEALAGLGDLKGAARAYLDSYSGYPDSAHAPEALLRLGRALDQLGQRDAACQTLAQVAPRYGSAPQALEAQSAMRNMGCQ